MPPPPQIDSAAPSWRESLPRLAIKLVVLVTIVILSHYLIDYALTWAETLPARAEARAERLILLAIFVTYALLIALPFVPGIEIAIALLVLRGPEFAVPIYLATMGGLSLAFLAGHLVPIRSLRRLFLDLHLVKAAALVDRLAPLGPDQRVRELQRSLPRKHARFAIRYRYVGLALLINMPGSGLIGGGGGICLMAGMSGVFTPRITLPTLAVAILPFPLFMWFAGTSGLMPWLPA
jgi:hypothetical protein